MKNKLATAFVLVSLLSGCRSPIFNSDFAQNDRIGTRNSIDSGAIGARDSAPRTRFNDLSPRDRDANSNPTSMSIADNLSRGNAALEQGQRLENQQRMREANTYYQQAKPHFRQILQVDGDHVLAHHRLAFVADKQRDFSTAEYHYQQALLSKPDDANLLSDLGYSYLLQGQYERSQRYLERALDRSPSHPQAQNNLGLLYGKQGRYNAALAVFRRTTGSDAAAQRKLEQLFPQSNAQPDTAIASRSGNPATADPATGQLPTSDVARELQEKMRLARLQSIAERSRQQALNDQAIARMSRQMEIASETANPPIGARLQPSQFLQENRTVQANPPATTHVPDHQLRDSLRNIDAIQNPKTNQRYLTNDPLQTRLPPAANRYAGTDTFPVRTPQTLNPLRQSDSLNQPYIPPNYGPPGTGPANAIATNSHPSNLHAPVMQTRPTMQNSRLSVPSNLSPHGIRQSDFAGQGYNATNNRQGFPGQSLDAETRAAAFLGMNAGPAHPFSVPNVGQTAATPSIPTPHLTNPNQLSPAASIPTHVQSGSVDQINTLRYQNSSNYTPPQQWPINPLTVPRTRLNPAAVGTSSKSYSPTTSNAGISPAASSSLGLRTPPRRLDMPDQVARPIESPSNQFTQAARTGVTPNGTTPASYQTPDPAIDRLGNYAAQLQQQEQELEQLKRKLSGQYQSADLGNTQWNDPANQPWNSPANQQWSSPENQQWRSPENQRWNTRAAQSERQWFPQPSAGQSGP